jgi:hypothetical protein
MLPVHLSKVIPIEFCQFFTHVLLRQIELGKTNGDTQVPTAQAVIEHEIMFETLQERLWPMIEKIVGQELLPTYSYARLYTNGDILEKHTDRPACEISVTLQLGRSHHYAWPIYMGGERFDLAEGDAIIYPGCDVEHWRNTCDGPTGYYSGQVFMHFVGKNGPYAAEAGDSSKREIPSYIRGRTLLMETK